MSEGLGRYAEPGIADLDHRATRGVGEGPHRDRVPGDVALRDRLCRVDEQIEEDLPQACLVAEHRRDITKVRDQRRAMSNLILDQFQRRPHHPRQIDERALVLVGAREDLQVTHDLTHAISAFQAVVEHLQGLRGKRRRGGRAFLRPAQLIERGIQIGDHDRQRVVDLVRDPGGQDSQGAHPVGEHDLLVELLQLGQVARDVQRARDVTLGVAQG